MRNWPSERIASEIVSDRQRVDAVRVAVGQVNVSRLAAPSCDCVQSPQLALCGARSDIRVAVLDRPFVVCTNAFVEEHTFTAKYSRRVHRRVVHDAGGESDGPNLLIVQHIVYRELRRPREIVPQTEAVPDLVRNEVG